METKTRKIRDFEMFYDSNKDSLLCDTIDAMKIVSEYSNIYHDVLVDFSDEAKPLLLQLMFRHYPDFKSINHIACIEYIDRIINNHIYTQVIHMCNLCRLYNEHCDLCDKYADLERFREYYHNPPAHSAMEKDEWREYFIISDEREYGSETSEYNKLKMFYSKWKQKRRNEYYQTIEPLLYYNLPQLHLFDGDYSVMYTTHRDVNYTLLESSYKLLETTLDFEMPPESIALDVADWKKLQQNYLHNSQKVLSKRNERIFM